LANGSGSTSYSVQESGDDRAGLLSQSETGTDRYGLLQAFNHVANTGGSTPGHLDFSPFGLPFQAPPALPPEDNLTPLDKILRFLGLGPNESPPPYRVPEPLVPEINWKTVADAAEARKIPTGMIPELAKLNNIQFKRVEWSGKQGARWSGSGGILGKDVVEMTPDFYDSLAKGTQGKKSIGTVIHELFHAYNHNIITKSKDGEWIVELMNRAATEVYLPLLEKNLVSNSYCPYT
jgi:hypothetical protein